MRVCLLGFLDVDTSYANIFLIITFNLFQVPQNLTDFGIPLILTTLNTGEERLLTFIL